MKKKIISICDVFLFLFAYICKQTLTLVFYLNNIYIYIKLFHLLKNETLKTRFSCKN